MKNLKRKITSVVFSLLICSVSACGNSKTITEKETKSTETETENNTGTFAAIAAEKPSSGKFIDGFKKTTNTDNYASPVYEVEKDHKFELPCSQDVGIMIPTDAFTAYTNDSLDSYGGLTVKMVYDAGRGVIVVSPDTTIEIGKDGYSNRK